MNYPIDVSDLAQESPFGGIDLPSDEFYHIHAPFSRYPPPARPSSPPRPPLRPQSQQSEPKSPSKGMDGPIYLPPQIFKLLSQDALKALKAYNTEAINRFTSCGRASGRPN